MKFNRKLWIFQRISCGRLAETQETWHVHIDPLPEDVCLACCEQPLWSSLNSSPGISIDVQNDKTHIPMNEAPLAWLFNCAGRYITEEWSSEWGSMFYYFNIIRSSALVLVLHAHYSFWLEWGRDSKKCMPSTRLGTRAGKKIHCHEKYSEMIIQAQNLGVWCQ